MPTSRNKRYVPLLYLKSRICFGIGMKPSKFELERFGPCKISSAILRIFRLTACISLHECNFQLETLSFVPNDLVWPFESLQDQHKELLGFVNASFVRWECSLAALTNVHKYSIVGRIRTDWKIEWLFYRFQKICNSPIFINSSRLFVSVSVNIDDTCESPKCTWRPHYAETFWTYKSVKFLNTFHCSSGTASI